MYRIYIAISLHREGSSIALDILGKDYALLGMQAQCWLRGVATMWPAGGDPCDGQGKGSMFCGQVLPSKRGLLKLDFPWQGGLEKTVATIEKAVEFYVTQPLAL